MATFPEALPGIIGKYFVSMAPLRIMCAFMNAKKSLAICCAGLMFGWTVQAQTPTSEDLDEIFGRHTPVSRDHAVHISLLDLVRGEANVSYEYVHDGLVGLELGAGILLPYYLPEISTWDADVVDNPSIGYGLSGQLRLYPGREVREGGYFGLLYRNRLYRSDLGSVRLQDVAFMGGYHYPFRPNWIFDFSYGIGGFWRSAPPDGVFVLDEGGVMMPILVKLVYIL